MTEDLQRDITESTGEDSTAGNEQQGAGTVLDNIGSGSGEQSGDNAQKQPDWRDDWAGDDEKYRKRLDNFSSPEDVGKSWRALEQKLSSGEYRRDLPEDANEEQIARWRDEQGIPKSPDGYELPEFKGFEWTEEDKPVIESFFKSAHARNAKPSEVNGVLGWYAEHVQGLAQDEYDKDIKALESLEDTLRIEWGGDYRSNKTLVSRYVENEFPGGADVLKARLPDGSRLGDKPEFLKYLAGRARSQYGDGGYIDGDAREALTSRKTEIEKIMRTDIDQYFREGHDKEYSEILQKEERSR